MPKVDVDYRDYYRQLSDALQSGGLLLAAHDPTGRANCMTIGWATMGPAWGRPIFTAMIRPSRYTYELVEALGDFTVNLMPKSFAGALSFCGTYSGRQHDKFAEQGLTAMPSRRVQAPSIEQALLVVECRVIDRTDLNPATLDANIKASSYPRGDFHRLYFGEVVAACAEADYVPS
jgi:flavin reductase (DIM6/NTAB) family NADH-FMN oxidoreductase RutF